jgi:hypothetical protein
MELRYIGIDVSRDRRDVCSARRDGKGLAELVARLSAFQPERIALEATGGFETVAAAARSCRW